MLMNYVETEQPMRREERENKQFINGELNAVDSSVDRDAIHSAKQWTTIYIH